MRSAEFSETATSFAMTGAAGCAGPLASWVAFSLSPVRMAATSGKHLDGSVTPPDHRVVKDRLRDVYEVNPDGNSVVMEEQLMKVSETQVDYQLATNIYHKHMRMFRTALGTQGQ